MTSCDDLDLSPAVPTVDAGFHKVIATEGRPQCLYRGYGQEIYRLWAVGGFSIASVVKWPSCKRLDLLEDERGFHFLDQG